MIHSDLACVAGDEISVVSITGDYIILALWQTCLT